MSINRPERVRALDVDNSNSLEGDEKKGLEILNADIEAEDRANNVALEDKAYPVTTKEVDLYLADDTLTDNPRSAAKDMVGLIKLAVSESMAQSTVNYPSLGHVQLHVDDWNFPKVKWYDTKDGPVVEVCASDPHYLGVELDAKRIIELNDPALYKYVQKGLVTIKAVPSMLYKD